MVRFLAIAAEPKDATHCGTCKHLQPGGLPYGCHLFGLLDYVKGPKRHRHCKAAELLMLDKAMKVREVALAEAAERGRGR